MSDLKKIIELIKKTGDRFITLDGDGNTYVVMNLKDYERLALGRSEVRGLTEDELLDKINRDIALWRSTQEEEKMDKWDDLGLKLNKNSKIRTEELSSSLDETEEDKFYFEPLE
jgi:hypothetical protein